MKMFDSRFIRDGQVLPRYGPLRRAARQMFALTLVSAACGLILPRPAAAQAYQQTNLVSDIPGVGQFTDPNLVNPWGMATSPTGPIWVANNHSFTSTIYSGSGTPAALVVQMPPAPTGAPGSPTGEVFNGTSSFSGDRFIWATEEGAIDGWSSGTTALTRAFGIEGSVYKGLATGNWTGQDFLYAANFATGNIDVFSSLYAQTTLPGSFQDPGLPAGYAPFNVQQLGGSLYVTYALKEVGGTDDVPGAGHGFVDKFGMDGSFQQRLATGGALNSPWGLAIAPGDFGQFSNDLLVGNFGDGTINAFDPANGDYLGVLRDPGNNPLQIEGLWGLMFGNDGSGGSHNSLYFTAGISGVSGKNIEDHGLFGMVQPVPEPASVSLLGLGLLGIGVFRKRRAV